MRRTTAWNRLMESTESPTVSIQIPREWAEELLRSLATSLEIEDIGDEPDELGLPHMEPDEDDLPGGMDDGDMDGFGAPGELDFGDEDDDEDAGDEELPAGDDDEDEDEDDVEEEAVDFADSDRETRPGTAFNESAFSKLAKKLGHEKGIKNPAGLAASIGRKKLGNKAFNAKAAAGRSKK